MNILFLGSGAFGLPALAMLAGEYSGRLRCATLPDAPRARAGVQAGVHAATPVKRMAAQLGCACEEVATLKKPAGLELLARTQAELVITADIRLMLPPSFLAAPPRGCFNLHASPLPKYRGAAPVARAILAGDQHFGVTLYKMARELDAGPMVAARGFDPPRKLATPDVEEHLATLAAELLGEWMPRLLSGEAELREQDASQVTFAPKLEKREGWIDWTEGAETVENHLLALKPWPRSFTRWRPAGGASGALIFLEEGAPLPAEPTASALPGAAAAAAGMVRAAGSDGIDVACGAGGRETFRITRLQREGKRAMSAAEFLRGNRLAAGDLLRKEAELR